MIKNSIENRKTLSSRSIVLKKMYLQRGHRKDFQIEDKKNSDSPLSWTVCSNTTTKNFQLFLLTNIRNIINFVLTIFFLSAVIIRSDNPPSLIHIMLLDLLPYEPSDLYRLDFENCNDDGKQTWIVFIILFMYNNVSIITVDMLG